jgi:hypothetical protein
MGEATTAMADWGGVTGGETVATVAMAERDGVTGGATVWADEVASVVTSTTNLDASTTGAETGCAGGVGAKAGAALAVLAVH